MATKKNLKRAVTPKVNSYAKPKVSDTKIDDSEEYRCSCCGHKYKKQEGNYIRSKSPVYKGNNGYMSVCKYCLSQLYDDYIDFYNRDEEMAAERICQIVDMYFDENAWAASRKNSNKRTRMGTYVSVLNLSQCAGTTYSDTLIKRWEKQEEDEKAEEERLKQKEEEEVRAKAEEIEHIKEELKTEMEMRLQDEEEELKSEMGRRLLDEDEALKLDYERRFREREEELRAEMEVRFQERSEELENDFQLRLQKEEEALRAALTPEPTPEEPKSSDYKPEVEENKVPEEVIRRFGIGFTEGEYDALQAEYDSWVEKYGIPIDKRQQELYISICYLKLNFQRSVQSNNAGIGSLANSYKSYIEGATTEIEDRKRKEEAQIEVDPLGVMIRDIERFTPAEFYKDKKLYADFDKLKEYINRFMTRPLRNLLTGSKEMDSEFNLSGDEEQ